MGNLVTMSTLSFKLDYLKNMALSHNIVVTLFQFVMNVFLLNILIAILSNVYN